MKINFRSALNIDSQFADWLDKILEPALEDHFTSTTEALEQLHHQAKLKTSTIQPLAGSSIQIKKQARKLQIRNREIFLIN